jgi:hypothetical protein
VWALAFVGLLGSILACVLASQSARVSVRNPLVTRPNRGRLVAVPLQERTSAAGVTTYALDLSSEGLAELGSHDELWLYVSMAAGVGIHGARLDATGTACRFDAGPGPALGENDPLILRHSEPCRAFTTRLTPLELTIEVEGRGPLGLWAYRPRGADSLRGPIRVEPSEPGDGPGPLSARGFLVDYPPTAPRVELLNAMWRLSSRPGWIWWAVAAAIGSVLAGCLVFPTSAVPAATGKPRSHFVLGAASGAALLALGVSGLYAVLTPPLLGPDEPYHLLGFADLVGDARLGEDTVAWMGQTHLWRIRYHPDERFRTVDEATSFVADDDQLRPTEVEMRSATLAKLWRTLSPVLRGRNAPQTLLAIRLLDAALFAAAVGTAAALAAGCAAAPFPQWLCFPFLFVPSLPFFAMHVSETAVLCSTYVVLATSLAVLFLDGPDAHWAGLPLGLATGLMLAGGRSPWPLAAIVAAALVTRLVLGAGPPARARRAALVFWSGFALGTGSFFLVLNDAFARMVHAYARFVPSALRPLAEWRGAPLLGVGLLVLAAVLESTLAPLRPRVASVLRVPAELLARWGAFALVFWVVVSLVGSLFLSYPQLPLEPRHPMSVGERTTAVLATMGTLFRLRDPNFLLSTTFWVGFGWLDAIPGPLFQSLLVVLTAVPTVGLLVALSRPDQVRRFVWLTALGLGGVVALVLYAVVTQELPMALQGRYLIGWYLVFLTVVGCWTASPKRSRPAPPPQAWPSPSPAPTAMLRPVVLLVVAGGIHVYCLAFILRRYF